MKNKLLMGLLSLVIAFGLWIYVITVVSPGSETTIYDVPVELKYEKSLHGTGYMVTDILDKTVDVKVEGNRSDLINLNKSNIEVWVDVSRIDRAGTLLSAYEVQLPENISNNAYSIKLKDPDRVRLVVVERDSDNVPVVLNYNIPHGFEVKEEILDKKQVSVVGPKDIVAQIAQAVVSVEFDAQTGEIPVSGTVVPCDKDGNPVDAKNLTILWDNVAVDTVEATLNVVRYKDLPLKATVLPGAGATEDNTSIDIQPQTLRVYGSEKALADLTEIRLEETIDLGQILTDEGEVKTLTYVLPPEVTTQEEGNEAKVTITFPELKTAEFTLSLDRVKMENIPEGLAAELDENTEILVKVRGSAELIDKLKEKNFLLTMDLTGVKVGSQKLDLKITLEEDFAQIGFISATPTAMVTVKQAGTKSTRSAGGS